jgi:hypothetical protein
MKYYKVKPEADQTPTSKARKYTGILIRNELYTAREITARGITPAQVEKHMDQVEVSKKTVFWSFGARFEKGKYR